MINQDVMDLYERVPLGAKVVVLPGGRSLSYADARNQDIG